MKVRSGNFWMVKSPINLKYKFQSLAGIGGNVSAILLRSLVTMTQLLEFQVLSFEFRIYSFEF